ncbi:YihY/virulence factor BrkB family protein [Actinoallomurus soli]|uniref:YihY/virulence factor BrkB family protein n=1 Tax=Actinoallomurus soli TaxID=2952535 RepID=UPI00209322DC|nr:YihY/virulence factor BrkB family protein [Actinoallomurus soli]MCO5972928.1 YihY/virulence factor BrkB family protein [Actinoallomurus soli]
MKKSAVGESAGTPETDTPEAGRSTAETSETEAPENTEKGTPEEEAPEPTDLGVRWWWSALRRTVGEVQRDELVDRAASLTYYGVLSVFPALLVLVSLLGLAGKNTLQQLIDEVGKAAPGPVRQLAINALTQLQNGAGIAGVAGLISLFVALWSSSGYIAAFMRASNVVYDVPEGRPLWKTLPIRLGITIVMLVCLTVTAVTVVVTGGIARRVGDLIGAQSATVTVWDIAKWPVLLLIVSFMFALLYWASPNAKQGFRWVSPGGVLAVVLWLVVSAGFAVYVANFGSYNKTYGSLAGVVVALIWLWMSNLAILFGAEFNAELERSRAIEAGLPPREEPYVELRDTRTIKDDEAP